jgi:hypothetical protein
MTLTGIGTSCSARHPVKTMSAVSMSARNRGGTRRRLRRQAKPHGRAADGLMPAKRTRGQQTRISRIPMRNPDAERRRVDVTVVTRTVIGAL